MNPYQRKFKKWLLLFLLLLTGCAVQFEDEDIGGKEVGAVQINFVGDQRRAQELVGYGRSLLGILKNQMRFNKLRALNSSVELPPRQEQNTLLYFMQMGDILEGTASLKKASITPVTATIYAKIMVSSIKGGSGMADVDKIQIAVTTKYAVKEMPSPKVIGFTVHFRDTSNWQQNVIYIVSEPYKTSSLSVGVTARSRDDISYTDLDAWRQDILHGGVASSQFYSPYWFETFGWQYRPTVGDPIYDQAAPIVGPKFFGDGRDLTIDTTIESIYGQPSFTLRATDYGLYAISKPDFNHVDTGKYDFEHGYVGKVECLLKTKKKQTKETAQKYSLAFVNDVAGGFDETVLTGNNLLVANPRDFLDGWYGIGMVTWDQGSGSNNNIGGFTFIWHLEDGTSVKKDFHDIQLASGNMAGAGTFTDINSGSAFALFNPTLGLLSLYEGISDAENPFFDENASYRNNFYPALRKPFDAKLKPTRTFNIPEMDGEALEVRKLASF